jgi:hypothetical protein
MRKVFSRVVTPEAVEAILTGEGLEPGLKEGPLQFALAYVRGTPTEICERIGMIGDVAEVHSAVFYTALGPLVALAFGTMAWSPPDATRRHAWVEDVVGKLGGDVKDLHVPIAPIRPDPGSAGPVEFWSSSGVRGVNRPGRLLRAIHSHTTLSLDRCLQALRSGASHQKYVVC